MCRLLITFANSLDADQARQDVGLIWIQTVWHSDGTPEKKKKKKSLFWKPPSDDKKHENLPRRQSVI